MGWKRLPKPCAGACEHAECELARREAATRCAVCKQPIGRRMYCKETIGLVHSSCAGTFIYRKC